MLGEQMLTEERLEEIRAQIERHPRRDSFVVVPQLLAHIAALSATIKRLETERDDALREIRLYDPRWMLIEWQAKQARGEVSAAEMPYAEKILTIQNEKWPAAAKPLLDWVASLQDRWDRSFNKAAALSLNSVETRS